MKRMTLLLAAAGLSILPLVGLAQREPDTTYEVPVVTVGPGPQRLAIDAGLLAAGAPFRVLRRGDRYYAEDGLTDLRLVTDGGRPVPHLLIQAPAPEREWIPGSVLSVAATKKTSGFEVDLGGAPTVDMVRVEGLPAPHLKRLTLEGSGDRARWTTLVAEGTLFDLPDEQLRQNTLGFAPGPYRYLRVTWNDANSGRVPNPSAVLARRVSTAPPPPQTSLVASIERRPSEPGISRFRVMLPAARLPIVALDLDVGPGAERRPRVPSRRRHRITLRGARSRARGAWRRDALSRRPRRVDRVGAQGADRRPVGGRDRADDRRWGE